LSDFLLDELASQVDMESVDGRARLAELARPLISRLPAGVYKELLIERLAESVGLATPKLEAILNKDSAKQSSGKPQANTRFRPATNAAGNPSIVRRAITLLLHHPKAADNLDIEKLSGVSKPGSDLLRDLIETVQSEPNMTTAGLLERWRNDEEGRHLGKLAVLELPESDDFDPTAELADCIAQLAVSARRDRMTFLIEKQTLKSLTDTERSELRALSQGSAFSG
jgi:DNA primase